MNAIINLLIPLFARNFLTSLKPVSFSIRTALNGLSKYMIHTHKSCELPLHVVTYIMINVFWTVKCFT